MHHFLVEWRAQVHLGINRLRSSPKAEAGLSTIHLELPHCGLQHIQSQAQIFLLFFFHSVVSASRTHSQKHKP